MQERDRMLQLDAGFTELRQLVSCLADAGVRERVLACASDAQASIAEYKDKLLLSIMKFADVVKYVRAASAEQQAMIASNIGAAGAWRK